MTASAIFQELEQRNLLFDSTDREELPGLLAARPFTLYAGFDPTADSLHVGNMVPLLALRRFQLAGHRPLVLAGGATGLIGDPSGKSAERNLLTKELLQHNLSRVKVQLQQFLDFSPGSSAATLLDNATWIEPISLLDFLRDVGKNFSVNRMIEKESVRARLEERDAGISYTEFSYMLLQAYDFYYLAKTHNCELQVGGSDQWGNITAGIDLIRRMLKKTAYGITFPLITTADGKKFGKTEQGTVWLDAEKTSPYRFYQFWLNTDDRDVVRFLQYFTFLPLETIGELAEKVQTNPERRDAQKALAYEMTKLVHEQTEADAAVKTSEALFGGSLEGLTDKQLADITSDMPSTTLEAARLQEGIGLVDLLTSTALSPSKGQARKDVESGGVYVNNIREENARRIITPDALLFGQFLLLRRGKKNYHMVRVQG